MCDISSCVGCRKSVWPRTRCKAPRCAALARLPSEGARCIRADSGPSWPRLRRVTRSLVGANSIAVRRPVRRTIAAPMPDRCVINGRKACVWRGRLQVAAAGLLAARRSHDRGSKRQFCSSALINPVGRARQSGSNSQASPTAVPQEPPGCPVQRQPQQPALRTDLHQPCRMESTGSTETTSELQRYSVPIHRDRQDTKRH
jgi:hypothetical protein